MEEAFLREAAAAFCRDGGTCPIDRLGEGNINASYLVRGAPVPFVLQKINGEVFPEPRRVIDNFGIITDHLRRRRRELGVDFLTAGPLRTLAGAMHYRDGRGGFWRAQTYLSDGRAGTLADEGQIMRAGRTLARFHLLAADLDVVRLAEPIPGFHHLPRYLAEFDRVLAENSRPAGDEVRFCLETIARERDGAGLLEEARESGVLAVQPIHGDPKIDNFIFSGIGEGMLDFDTVGAGLIHYDLGDCLRSCCNRAGERGGDSGGVSFDLGRCRLLLAGYFTENPLPGEAQRALIFEAVSLITFELGVRFFTDHLRGNTYFRVAEDGENLARAVRQFRLVADIAAKEREIRGLIKAVSEARNQ